MEMPTCSTYSTRTVELQKEATMMGYYDNGWNLWMIAMMLAWPILLALAIWAVLAVTGQRAKPQRETPGQILDVRLASGEITEQEYARTRQLLKHA